MRSMRPAIRNVRPPPRSISTGSARASASSSSSERPAERHLEADRLRAGRRRTPPRGTARRRRGSPRSRARESPRSPAASRGSAGRARPARSSVSQSPSFFRSGRRPLVATAAQQRRVDVVQLGAARQRIEPDVLVALAIVHRTQAEATLQEEPERTRRRPLELGDRERIRGSARIEQLPRLPARSRRTR